MSSASKVVCSSYVGLAHAHDESGPADVDEENLLTPRPGSYTPHEASANLDWEEDDLVFSAYTSLQQPIQPSDQNQNQNYREHVTAGSRPARVDERTALLPRLPEETSVAITSRHCATDVTGRSTFNQTVNHFFPNPAVIFDRFLLSSYVMLPVYCLALACSQSLLHSRMQDGSLELCS